MRTHKCDSCANARPIISENGLHHICKLSGTKVLRCMANDDFYIPIVRPEDIAKDRAFKEALRKAVAEFDSNS